MEMLGERSPLRVASEESVDAWVYIGAIENSREGADLPQERRKLLAQAAHPFLERRLNFDVPWLTCRFPTPAMAQDAGMSLRAFEEFFWGTVLLDWDAEGEKMQRIKERFDQADEVRIVGARDRPALQHRRPRRPRRRRPREHAGRRGLLLAGRGFDGGSRHVLGVPGGT